MLLREMRSVTGEKRQNTWTDQLQLSFHTVTVTRLNR
jgi:hypothetical protein